MPGWQMPFPVTACVARPLAMEAGVCDCHRPDCNESWSWFWEHDCFSIRDCHAICWGSSPQGIKLDIIMVRPSCNKYPVSKLAHACSYPSCCTRDAHTSHKIGPHSGRAAYTMPHVIAALAVHAPRLHLHRLQLV